MGVMLMVKGVGCGLLGLGYWFAFGLSMIFESDRQAVPYF